MVYWKAIHPVDMCKVEDNEVFHCNQVIIVLDKTDLFIQKSPNPQSWEISNSEKLKTTCLDICFRDLDEYIDFMYYCYKDIH